MKKIPIELQLSRIVLLQLLSVVGGLRSDESVIVLDDLLLRQLSVVISVGDSDQMSGLGLGVVESGRSDPILHLLLQE